MRFSFGKKQESDKSSSEESEQKNLSRPSAEQIYRQVLCNAREELDRTTTALAISGFAGGTFMGLSALGTAIALGRLGHGPIAAFCARMFYPLGFIVVILGRAQLFTENTLYPVALVLAEKKHLLQTMRLWGTVLPMNVLGALAFAGLASYTHGVQPAVLESLVKLGVDAGSLPVSTIFWSGVMAGWIIAMVAWLVSGSHSISGSIAVIWILTFVVGLGDFAHCIAGSGEVLAAVLTHHLSWLNYPRWFFTAAAGNVCGGICMVTILEYGQVIYGGDSSGKDQAATTRTLPRTNSGAGILSNSLTRATQVQTAPQAGDGVKVDCASE